MAAASTVYVETSVVSYLTARPSRDIIRSAHQELTKRWWRLRRDQFNLYCSQLVVDEAAAGDLEAAKDRLAALKGLPLLAISDLATNIARTLIQREIVPKKAAADALHMGIAAAHGMGYLLTWNCRHLANAEIRNSLIDVCTGWSCEAPVICTPEELMGT